MSNATVPTRRPGLARRLLSPLILVVGILLLFVVWLWPGNEADRFRVLKLLSVLALIVMAALRVLRDASPRRRAFNVGLLCLIALPMLFFRLSSMDGNFVPVFVKRSWVQDVAFGGSPDTLLERHRQEQGSAGVLADLTERAGDWPG